MKRALFSNDDLSANFYDRNVCRAAWVLAEEKQNALDAGVNDFLPKPMDMDLMASMIRSYFPAA